MIKKSNGIKNITYVLLVLSALLIMSSPAQAAVAPDLGATANFAVLAGTGVDSAGTSTIFGDVGVSPGASITGFPPGILNGSRHPGDALAAQAQSDLAIAFTNVSAQAPTAFLTGELGGLPPLTPGVYKFNTSATLTAGDLTLDAGGNPDAVFIFQIGTTLTTSGNAGVIRAGNAISSNVFWQVGDSATLSSTATFRGTILAQNSITLISTAAGPARIDGRALARNGAVTLNSNLIEVPQIIRLVNLVPSAVPNGIDKLPMSVTVLEPAGPISDAVILSSNRTQDIFDVPLNQVVTNATGQALFNITSTLPGVAKITATTGKATVSTNVVFVTPGADVTAPVVSITAPLNGTTVNTSIITVSGTATDDVGVTNVTVNGSAATITPGTIVNFSANVTLAAGDNTITVVALDAAGNSGTATVNVTFTPVIGQLTAITVTPATVNLTLNSAATFTATARDQNGTPMAGIIISWISSNTTVGTVAPASAITGANGNATTTFTALAPGTATVTAASGNVSGNATVTVTSAQPVLTTITVLPASITVPIGNITSFIANAFDQFGAVFPATVTWTSSNIAVGTITESGAFTALAPGATIITATNGTVSGNATARVSKLSIVVLPFDTNGNDGIDRPEAVDAVVRFFNNDPLVPRPTAVAVVVAFFQV